MIYLTFTNEYSGVFQSQVLDVASFFEREFQIDVHVVAVLSMRGFWHERARLKAVDPRITVLPMFPGLRNWRHNLPMLQFLARKWRSRALIGRSEIATCLGLRLRDAGVIQSVVFDGRSARAAENEEYVRDHQRRFSDTEVGALEQECIVHANTRLAVSEALVSHWRERYDYQGDNHVVIPCTLNANAPHPPARARADFGIPDSSCLMVYSGSSSQWQSFDLLDSFAITQMESDPKIELLLLSDIDPNRLGVYRRFPDRVHRTWVDPSEVPSLLRLADFGIVLREPSTTNRVASPTKFAEYLDAGLRVLISPEVGDLSNFVERHECGAVVEDENAPLVLARASAEERDQMRALAAAHFTKRAFHAQYAILLNAMGFEVR